MKILTGPTRSAVKTTATLTILKRLSVLCCAFATTAVFGQTDYVWTNGVDIGIATNWSPNGQPSGASEDTAEWNGIVPGNLNLIYQTGWPSTGFGTDGVNLYVSSNNPGSVTIVGPAAGSPAAGINGITMDAGAGSLILGDQTTDLLNFATRPGNTGQIHSFVNNSTNPAVMNSSVAWVAGGGDACVMDFSGTGNWIINHNLRDNNSGAGPITVTWEGPGTMTWSNGGTFLASDPLGPININSGTVILNGAGLCPFFASGVPAGNNTVSNGGALEFNSLVPDNISRVITGPGILLMNQGTLTLSAANTYSNNTVLDGGALILNAAETPGVSGPIGESNMVVFSGGTLEFSVNNTFDYSSRFSTNSNQHFNFNTGGQSVTFASGLVSSGGSLSQTGPGTLTLAGTNDYTGATVVNSGTLVFQGPMSGDGAITVADSATLGVTASSAQLAPATLTLGSSGGAVLEFFNVSSTSTPLVAANTISSAGTQTISISSGAFTVGKSYPLFSWTTGPAPAVVLGALNGYAGTVSTNGNSIELNITGTGYTWTGANNGNWDTTSPDNWLQNGAPAVFANGAPALLNDSATGTTAIVLNGVVRPSTVTVDNTASNYSITSAASDDIAGTTSLTKEGTNTLTMSGGANTYTGQTAILDGIVSVGTLASAGSPSDIGAASSGTSDLLLNGGTLQYTGAQVSITRPFTIGTDGGTIDSSGSASFTWNGAIAYSGTGTRSLTLTGTDNETNIFASVLSDNTNTGGSTSLVKNGSGFWYLTANNSFSGGTEIEDGTLQLGIGGSSGTVGAGAIVDDGTLVFNLSGTQTFGTVSGSGAVVLSGPGEIILPGNNTYANGTTINSGTLEIGAGNPTASIDALATITDNGALIFNSGGAITISGAIGGSGSVEQKGSGLLKFIGNNVYTGNTIIDSNSVLQLTQGNTGTTASSNIIDNGTLLMERQDNGVFIVPGNITGSGSVVENVSNGNGGDSTLDGTNTYTGGTFILGGGLILGDDNTPGAGSIVGNVYMTNNVAQATFGPYVAASITFNRPDNFTFPGNIVGQGFLTQEGSGTMTVTGALFYTNGTTISAGTLQIGAGGLSGSIFGAITNNSDLVFDLAGNQALTNPITGFGAVVQMGSGVLSLFGANTYTGATIVSDGTLFVTNLAGDVDVDGGTLGAGVAGSIATMNVSGNMYILGGALQASLDTSMTQSNTMFVVGGLINNTNGVLTLFNDGPALVAGQTFTLFSAPVTGQTLTIDSPGFTVTNNLALNGTITVTAVAPPGSDMLGATLSGGQLHLSWPAAYTGLVLQSQTNSLGTNWVAIPGTDAGNTYSITVNKSNASVFYRLAP